MATTYYTAVTWGTVVTGGGYGVRVGLQFAYAYDSGGNVPIATDDHVSAAPRYWVWPQVNTEEGSNSPTYSGDFSAGPSPVVFSALSGGSWNPANQRMVGEGARAEYPLTYGTPGSKSQTWSVNITNMAEVRPTVTASLPLPARPISAPTPPASPTATRVSDSRADLAWSGSPPASAPWADFVIDRETDTSVATVLSGLAGTARSWSDTSLGANRRYRWTLYSRNSAGASSGAATGYVYTTPSAGTAPAWEKTGSGDVILRWTVAATWASKQWVEDSADGGATWSKVSPDLSGTAGSWTHTAPSTSVTHRYRVVVQTPNGLSATSAASTGLQLLAAPTKPTGLAPNGVAPLAEDVPLSWRHSPVDGTPQQQFEVEHRASAVAAWTSTGALVSAVEAWELLAGTYGSGQPQWRVRTKGAHVDWSPWSDVAALALTARPVGGFTTPGPGGTWDSSELTLQGTYHDPEGTPLTGWRLRLLRDGAVVKSASGSALPIRVAVTGLIDGATYVAEEEVRDTPGLWSAVAAHTFTVAYAPPALPLVRIDYDRDQAAAVIVITNPDAGPTVVRNEVWSDGTKIGETVTGGSVTFRVPDLAGATIVVRAVSSLPSSADTAPLSVPIPALPGIHLNAGEGWGLHCAMWAGNPQVRTTPNLDVVAETYDGDELPSPTYGPQRGVEVQLSGRVRFDEPGGSSRDWQAVLADRDGVICYRDGLRRVFGFITAASFTETNNRWAEVQVTIAQSKADPASIAGTQRVAVVEDPPGEYRVMSSLVDVSVWDLLE